MKKVPPPTLRKVRAQRRHLSVHRRPMPLEFYLEHFIYGEQNVHRIEITSLNNLVGLLPCTGLDSPQAALLPLPPLRYRV